MLATFFHLQVWYLQVGRWSWELTQLEDLRCLAQYGNLSITYKDETQIDMIITVKHYLFAQDDVSQKRFKT